ncbi:MAG TPA: RNase H family protein, partial [Roseiflexaceae bacterium]|nr:RNase H family protein [Roseiflexaceae bacterium]
AARGNPGPGGWAALLEFGERERLLSGEGPEHTTNNAMELLAAAAALEALKRPCRVTLRADSQYVIDGLTRLLRGGGLPEKNRELWQRLRAAAQPHEILFEWVRGHSGDERNERVDRAANSAASRAYLASEVPQTAGDCAQTWTLAICSAAADRPVRWALQTHHGRRSGEATTRGTTQPTAVYHALVAGLEAARDGVGAAEAALDIVTNYELIVKQGRGEWRVRNPDQRVLAERAAELRGHLCAAQFRFAPTKEVLALVDQEAVN